MDFPDRLFDRTLRFLSYRPRSEKELREYLVKKKASDKEVSLILTRLSELKIFDDREFTAWWIRSRQLSRPKGQRVIRMELKQKGISQDIIDEVFDQGEEVIADSTLIQAIATKQAPKIKHETRQEFVQKLGMFLMRRGFSYEDIRPVVDALAQKEYN